MSRFNVNSAEIEDYVEEMAKNPRKDAFYPQTVSRKLNIPLDIVLLELSRLRDDGKIDLKYEIRCLEDLNTIITVDDYNSLLEKELFCEMCGKEINITYNHVYPIFYINNEYKEHVKKNCKIKIDKK